MIYLFHGSDIEKVRAKAFEWVAKARTKESSVMYARLAREELSAGSLEYVAAAGGLFVQRLLVLLDDPFATREADEGDEEKKDLVDEYLERLVASDNAVILLAPKLSAAKVKKIAPKAKMVYVFDKKTNGETARGFNSALVNALGAKNKSALWLELNKACRAGDAPEMLHGLLHWKARDLMTKGSRAWTQSESRALSLNLIALLQESRRGGLELGVALERFALSI